MHGAELLIMLLTLMRRDQARDRRQCGHQLEDFQGPLSSAGELSLRTTGISYTAPRYEALRRPSTAAV